jgi:adenosylmethionine-8-amino-7-oxononanoate aminotransferase
MSLTEKDRRFIWHPYTPMREAQPIPIVKGEGACLIAEDGTVYLDLVSSWWTNLHGHAHAAIAEKISAQAKKLEHVLFAGFTHPPAIELSERLLSHLPSGQRKVFFSDNGSTAVEVAIKMAVQFWKNKMSARKTIVAFYHAYHGDTFGAMAASERGLFTRAFHEMLFEVKFIQPPVPGMEKESLMQAQQLLGSSGNEIAAFLFEPLVQGAAGMRMHSAAALDELIRLFQKNNALCIADEVMTGFGRTGKFFASGYLNTRPDIFCLSKGLTGGFMPMGITTCTQEIFDAFLNSHGVDKTFYHGHSYTANPLACAAALASLDLMEKKETSASIENIIRLHQRFLEKIKAHPLLIEARQTGTILALEFKTGEHTSYTHPLRERLYQFFLSRGMLLRPLGNVLYLMPPYCITGEQLQRVYEAIEEFLAQVD